MTDEEKVVEVKPDEPIVVEPGVQKQVALDDTNKVHILRQVHAYFSNFDRVPGSMAATWSNALDALAHVSNSLVADIQEAVKKAGK